MNILHRLVLAIALFAAGVAGAQWNSSAEAPFAPKALNADPLHLAAGHKAATRVTLAPIGADAIDEVKLANTSSFTKRLQIGVGRPVSDANGTARALSWTATASGSVAHWNVTSPGARALRVGLDATRIPAGTEIRFAALSQPETVYGPFTARDLLAEAATYWSPVIEGETAIVEVMLPFGVGASELELSISQLSHLFASPSDPAVESQAKASQSCERDLICLSASDSALADTGRSVAKMTFTDGLSSSTYLCTGTLLNPVGGSFTPYFYGANHCISTQSSASTLTTHWFYDRTTCGGSIQNPGYTQLTGGATLLYANAYSDGLLLRLNSTPPSGAVYSGWDAATVSIGAAATAVHHPAGDYKKVSLGSMASFTSPTGSDTNFLQVNWNSTATGVTEGGSSGSGIFTLVASPREYRLRGGLYGGPSSCTASSSSLHDYYSRFDQVYPSIAQYLNPGTVSCSYTLSPTSVTIGSTAATGSFTATASSSGCAVTASSDASWLTTSVSGSTVSYSAAANTGSARVGNIAVGNSRFTVTQQAPLAAAGSNLVSNPGFETGSAGWTESATGGFPIVTDDSTGSHAGRWYAWLGGYDSGTDTLYQTVTIPSGSNTASLRFFYWIETEELTTSISYDVMTVSIANATTGARIATLATFSNLNETTGWVQSNALDLSSYRGQTLRLVFTATTDSSRVSSFYIDDITLTASGGTSSTNNYTSLWWKGADESGWGLNVNHQGDATYSTLFTYDSSGAPMWLVSTGARTNGDNFTGDLLRTTGPAFNANPFTPITGSNVTNVGSMTLAFQGDTGTLTYSVNGTLVVKSIQKQVFGTRAAQCVNATGDRSALTNYQDLWWAGAGESGWGINLTHQDNTIFATLFTYRAGGGTANPGMWLVASMPRQPDGSYLGILYATTGPAFNASPWTSIISTNVGTMSVRFTGGNSGTLTYFVNGTQVVKSISRTVFSSPVPACTS